MLSDIKSIRRRETAARYREKHREAYRITSARNTRNSNRRRRIKLIDFLGGKCIKCGFSDYRALQVDHTRGDGKKHREEEGNKFCYKLYKSVAEDTSGRFQLLCANCNWIRKSENNENPCGYPVRS